jgi:hypothetical protein
MRAGSLAVTATLAKNSSTRPNKVPPVFNKKHIEQQQILTVLRVESNAKTGS